jgi:polyvinyl alcohol dehydrogenase (cytochrome)
MKYSAPAILLAVCAVVPAGNLDEGKTVYAQRCAVCHDQSGPRIPAHDALAHRTANEIVTILKEGVMTAEAEGLTDAQMRSVAYYLTAPAAGAGRSRISEACPGGDEPVRASATSWIGWGRDLENSRYQPNPGLSVPDIATLKLKWAFALPGTMAYGQPVIAGRHLFMTSQQGRIFSLNANTGCTYWSAEVGAGVRTAIQIGVIPTGAGSRSALFFGDDKSYVQALDAATGELLWRTKVEEHALAHITGSLALYEGRLYAPVSSMEEGAGLRDAYPCCTFRGSVVALDARSGDILWKAYTISRAPQRLGKSLAGVQRYGPAGAAVWSAPTIDVKRRLLYVGTGNAYTEPPDSGSDAIVAINLDNGTEQWTAQLTPGDNFLIGCSGAPHGSCPTPVGPDHDFGSSPILHALPDGRQLILAGQKSGVIYALDPYDRGRVLWKTQVGVGGALGGIQWGSAADERNVYVPVSDVLAGERGKPGLTAVDIRSGEVVWRAAAPKVSCSWGGKGCTNAYSSAVSAIPGVVFAGSMDGHLRAYSAADGQCLWDYDTAHSYDAVNGASAAGGSLDGSGPVIANGVLYVTSGYGRFVGQPGNVLLAFTVDGR